MPALAMTVISLSSMPPSRSQYASVPATSRNGRPEENPKKNIVHAAGCANAFQTEGLTAFSELVVIVHRERGVVGKTRRARDRAGAQLLAQVRGHELVVDAP